MWAHSSISLHLDLYLDLDLDLDLHLDSKQWKYDDKLPEYHILEGK